jgi:hypothetical protein
MPKVDFVDDGPGKPVGINKFIGRRGSSPSAIQTATSRCWSGPWPEKALASWA